MKNMIFIYRFESLLLLTASAAAATTTTIDHKIVEK
jgi:hypothetical protein